MSGPHGDLVAVVAVAGDFGPAKPVVGRWGGAVDRQHIEYQVLAFALCFLQKHADEPAPESMALMAGVDFDARQVDLPRTVLDIQHADIGLPGGDDLPPVRVEGAVMKRALNPLIPPPDRRDVVAHGGLVQPVAELGVGGGGRPERDSGLGKAGPARAARRPAHTLPRAARWRRLHAPAP